MSLLPYIHLKDNVVEYEFTCEQKYLFIRGDSGRGKSTLVELAELYMDTPSSVTCLGDSNLKIIRGSTALEDGYIYFFDESDVMLTSENAKLFKAVNSYFVIISRDRNLDFLKTGLDSLCEIVTDGSYHTIKPIYPRRDKLMSVGDVIVCEDSGSGLQFLDELIDYQLTSANGKDNIGSKVYKLYKQGFKSFTVVYDRCGICFSYEDQLNYLSKRGIHILSEIDWDSFESYILESDLYNIEVPWFPDKENNAFELFVKHMDANYDKSKLPDNIELPVYWKVKDLVDLLKQPVSVDSSLNLYPNITKYKNKRGLSDSEFDSEKERLFQLLDVSSLDELEKVIVKLSNS